MPHQIAFGIADLRPARRDDDHFVPSRRRGSSPSDTSGCQGLQRSPRQGSPYRCRTRPRCGGSPGGGNEVARIWRRRAIPADRSCTSSTSGRQLGPAAPSGNREAGVSIRGIGNGDRCLGCRQPGVDPARHSPRCHPRERREPTPHRAASRRFATSFVLPRGRTAGPAGSCSGADDLLVPDPV